MKLTVFPFRKTSLLFFISAAPFVSLISLEICPSARSVLTESTCYIFLLLLFFFFPSYSDVSQLDVFHSGYVSHVKLNLFSLRRGKINKRLNKKLFTCFSSVYEKDYAHERFPSDWSTVKRVAIYQCWFIYVYSPPNLGPPLFSYSLFKSFHLL